MFPLTGSNYPKSSEELAASIQTALGEVLTFPPGHVAVMIQGGEFPALKRVDVDLSDGSIRSQTPPPPLKPKGDRISGPTVEQLNVIGKPIRYQGRGVDFELSAAGIKFDFARAASGKPMLVAREAESGRLAVSIAHGDLQFIIRSLAAEAAKRQGVTIQELDLHLAASGPRSVDAQVRVKARKLMMSGTLTLRGHVEIDPQLAARLSNLSCGGEGMLGNMAAGMIQGKLRQMEREILLRNFSLGGLALRDLNISTEGGLKITADVGKA